MRRAVFGGSFNPIHRDHIRLALRFADEFSLDKVTLIPTNSTPLKDNSAIADGQHRYNMCCLATEDHPVLEVSDIELSRPGMSYTSDTLRALINDDDELFLIVGADMYVTLDRWRDFRFIFEHTTILVAPRNELDHDSLLEKYKTYEPYGCRTLISSELVGPISSTYVRECISRGEGADDLLDPKVLRYIRTHGLYR